MRVYIPELGTVLTLAEDWTFKVINERRNKGLAEVMGITVHDYYFPFGTKERDEWGDARYGSRRQPTDPGSYTFPAGTSFEVDRIYVRKGNEEFSSVTFKTRIKSKTLRFFAKLDDVNRMEI